MKIEFSLNGSAVEVEARSDEMLLGVLRRLGLHSVRETCSIGVCGTCTVLVDGDAISSCIYLVPLVRGREVITVDGITSDDPVIEAFSKTHAYQCGYCTPGMVLAARSLLQENPKPTEDEIKRALSGNLCRCGSYLKIIEAVKRAAA